MIYYVLSCVVTTGTKVPNLKMSQIIFCQFTSEISEFIQSKSRQLRPLNLGTMHRSIMSITSHVFSTLFLDLDAKRHEVEEICEGEYKSKRQQRREENPAALGHVMMEADNWCVALNDAATRNCWTTLSPFPFRKGWSFWHSCFHYLC